MMFVLQQFFIKDKHNNKSYIYLKTMLPNPGIFVGIFAGLAFLYFLKRHCAGGRCMITKDLSNDIAVVTGGNTGIGKETARKLSELGCKVIIGARDVEKSKRAVQQMAKNKGVVIALKLDLSDKSSIESFAKQVQKQIGDAPLNYLVNNAGLMAIPEKKITKQGLQMQIGVNHFGHFYLTYLLWGSLKKANNPRIINVSSRAHKNRGNNFDIDFDDMNYQKNQYGAFQAYSRSKKANILFTRQLQRKMDQAKLNGLSISLHPGVVRTQLSREMLNSAWKRAAFTLLSPFSYILMKSAQQGAQTTLQVLLDNEDKLKGGKYYSDCQPSPLLATQCQSDQAAKKLWQKSEKEWNIKFNV